MKKSSLLGLAALAALGIGAAYVISKKQPVMAIEPSTGGPLAYPKGGGFSTQITDLFGVSGETVPELGAKAGYVSPHGY